MEARRLYFTLKKKKRPQRELDDWSLQQVTTGGLSSGLGRWKLRQVSFSLWSTSASLSN